jgi:LmbE family N-acetylglucosaminyl deacetylase
MTDPAAPADHTWRPARFMVIAAHPDDAEFGPSGTAARWIDAGSEGWLVCCTSGDQGGEDPDADPLALAALRETEHPETVFYKGGGINHTDHRAAGIAAVDAVYPASRNPMAFPWLARSGLAAHKVRRLYLFWSDESDTWVDISTTIERKIDALRAHASQIHDVDGLAARIRSWAAEEGAGIGAAAAEGLRLVVIDDDEDEGPR